MQQVRKISAAFLLFVGLVMVTGCVAFVHPIVSPHPPYPPPNPPKPPPFKNISQLKFITNFVDDATWETNQRLANGEWLAQNSLIPLEFEGNKVSALKYDFSYGNVLKYTANGTPKVRLYSTTDNVAFVVYHFNDLEPSQYISYVEIIGDADFNRWQAQGFAFGIRHGGSDHYSWIGPVDGNHNWIFSYSFHESRPYFGGVPSVAIAVANGDVMRIKQLRVVVSDVEEHLRRDGERDPHFIQAYTSNEFYDPNRVDHFYNGVYFPPLIVRDPYRPIKRPIWDDPIIWDDWCEWVNGHCKKGHQDKNHWRAYHQNEHPWDNHWDHNDWDNPHIWKGKDDQRPFVKPKLPPNPKPVVEPTPAPIPTPTPDPEPTIDPEPVPTPVPTPIVVQPVVKTVPVL